ncbi:MAG TPA: immune inhibitor A domain-containing protein [Thermoanaerobaculia bacterium]|nr:immune inhibitor A domain-containing protein [Thermoanaerobaculia bacterium]
MKLSVSLCLAVLFAAFPLAAQEEEILPPLPMVDGERASISVTHDEDGERRIVGSDNFPSPKANAQAELRREAVRQQLATGRKSGRTHEVARGQYVDFPVERTDRVFVMLVEFGTQGGWVTSPAVPVLSQTPGPLHNTIAQPDRSVNNTTIWQPDYNREHYVDMYFNQMVEYYKAQSSGRYTFTGEVMHWVKVPFNGPRYGNNTLGDASMWTLIADTVNTWTAAQLASGKTIAEVTEYLKTFDVADRYDHDKDGNFNEPDGYIDHFQIVHAGAGEETGGGILGADAIWSHRWFAFYHLGTQGPAYNKDGGVQFGGGWGANPTGTTLGSAGGHVRGISTSSNVATVTNAYPATPTGIWVGDYTVQPENGGLGVFAHEYGHDLGLPDHYDTAGGNNSTGYWTIMSSGSYLGEGGEDVGARPGDFNAWDKLQLGWLTYDLAEAGRFSVHKLGPAENTTKAAQAVVIPLPANQNFKFDYDAAAVAGANGRAWISGTGNNYDASMIRAIDVPATGATLTMRLAFNLETNWDYAYVSVSTNGGTSWTNLASTGLTTNTNANNRNLGNGITGSTAGAWRDASFNLTAYAGQTVLLRIRYVTDPATFFWGIAVDDIAIGTFADDAESTPNGWTLNKFVSSSGKTITNKPHYYIAEFRQYRGYDTGLQTGPYAGTGYVDGKVAHYPYQDGLLVTYADEDWTNNNTSVHAGEGFALPVDARPTPRTRRGVQEPGTDRVWNFSPWASVVQTFDATFGLEPTDALLMPFVGTLPPLPGSPQGSPNRRVQFELAFPSEAAEPLFSDLNSYWSPAKADASVIIPRTGTTIRVISTSAHDSFMHLQVNGN